MKSLILFALLLVVVVLAGCLGPAQANTNRSGSNLSGSPTPRTPGMDQFLNNSTATLPSGPIAPNPLPNPTPESPPSVIPSNPAANASAPTIVHPASVGGGSLGWDQKDALKIALLRKGETMEFTHWQIRLEDISYANAPYAEYLLLSGEGQPLSNFTLGQNQSYRFNASDGVEYLVVAVFNIGEGIPSAVQTQAYRISDLSRSASGVQIGAPMNAYDLKLEFPEPKLLVNQTLSIGQAAMAGEIGAELAAIDRSTTPISVSFRLLDSAKSEIGRAVLRNGQMVDVRMPSNERYSVVLAAIAAGGDQVTVSIYQTMSFRTNTVDANNTNVSG